MTDINTNGTTHSTNEPALEVPTFTAEQLAELQREAARTLELQQKAALRRAKLDRVTIVAGQVAGGIIGRDDVTGEDSETVAETIASAAVAVAVRILDKIEALP